MDAIQLVQLAGAVLVLAAYALAQAGRLQLRSLAYMAPNVVGAGALAVIALLEQQWGFLLLEGVWTVVSLWALAQRARVLRPAQ
jgi:hypothetical protein